MEVELEEQMEKESLERAELREKRKNRVEALKKQYQANEIHLSGDDLGYVQSILVLHVDMTTTANKEEHTCLL